MTLSSDRFHTTLARATPIPRLAPALAVALFPALAAAQDRGRADAVPARSATVTSQLDAHASHAALHAPAPVDAAVELIALTRLERLDADAGAMREAAELALTAGLLTSDVTTRLAWFDRGAGYARDALAREPDDPDALFILAGAIGLRGRHAAIGEKVRAIREVLDLTERILSLDPDHPGGLHLRGQLGAEAMRMNPVIRYVVERVVGGDALAEASWEQSESDLRRAMAVEPDDPSHRIQLARVLEATGRTAEARSHLEDVVAAPVRGALAEYYRSEALRLLGTM